MPSGIVICKLLRKLSVMDCCLRNREQVDSGASEFETLNGMFLCKRQAPFQDGQL